MDIFRPPANPGRNVVFHGFISGSFVMGNIMACGNPPCHACSGKIKFR